MPHAANWGASVPTALPRSVGTDPSPLAGPTRRTAARIACLGLPSLGARPLRPSRIVGSAHARGPNVVAAGLHPNAVGYWDRQPNSPGDEAAYQACVEEL